MENEEPVGAHLCVRPGLLQVDRLRAYFRTAEGLAKAVDDVTFSIDRGETFAIVGESGCGKSVTALAIMQLLPQPSGHIAGGRIILEGVDIATLSDEEKRRIRGKRISMIFQEPMTSLNPVFTIGYQVYEAIRLHQNVTAHEARRIAVGMLGKVGIPDPERRYDDYPHQMSGGMKQRVMIAMALSCKPDILIADEPTTALDVTIQAQILNLMKDLQKELGTAILLITHDLGVVHQMADRVAVMYAGRIVETADRATVFDNYAHPYTIKLFQSLPSQQKRGGELQVIQGMVPRATRFPEGCRFAERCDCAMDVCRRKDAELIDRGRAHRIACHLYTEGRESAATDLKERSATKGTTTGATTESNGSLLRVEGMKMHFPIRKGLFRRTVGHVKAVDGIDLEIPVGKTLSLVGESGCGKTTVGKCLLQLHRPTAGRAIYRGAADLFELTGRRLHPFRKKLQIIFQDPYSSLNPRMMVGEIIGEGMRAHRIGTNAGERHDKVAAVMRKVGLDPEMALRYPHEFSGGQRQRIAIARALAVEPEFVICDEATSALDVSVQAQILNLLKKLQREEGLTYLFITHNLGVVEYLSDIVAVMYLGRIVEQGTVDEIFREPKHPYTQALLAAIPRIDDKSGLKKISVEGDVPSPINPPQGCHFHPRCPKATAACREAYPDPVRHSPTHTARCIIH